MAWSNNKSSLWCATINNATVAAGTTRYSSLGNQNHGGTESLQTIIVPFRCLLRNLYINTHVAVGVGETLTVTVRINGVNTLLSSTISGAAQTSNNDLVNRVIVNAGDTFIIEIVATNNGAWVAPFLRWSLECDSH